MHKARKLLPSEFPLCLKEIPDPPPFLYIEGDLPSYDDYTYLAVVGSRRYSAYGKEVCEKLIAGLAGSPIVIVSGLALGIDSIAHKAAMNAGLPTIAIPGSGLDRSVIAPRSHTELANQIVASGGALISEHEPLTHAAPYTFPSRNRIMAGLCTAILLIEAHEKSGTLITARLAMEYNRDVLVVPGSIFSLNSKGGHMFIRSGATPVASSEEILDALDLTPGETKTIPTEPLSPHEQIIFDLLLSPTSRDDLLEESGLPPSETNIVLMTMELKGLIKEIGGEFQRV